MKQNEQPETPLKPEGQERKNEFNFLHEADVLQMLKVSRRTLHSWRTRGLIPFIRLPGGRRILYDAPSLRAALLRQQRGGVE